MSLSVSLGKWRVAADSAPPFPTGALEPEVLREAGILTDPSAPVNAVKRARTLLQQGRCREARALLAPHLGHGGSLGASAWELTAIAVCATSPGDCDAIIDRALEVLADADDRRAHARIARIKGEALLSRGELSAADDLLSDAAATLAEVGDLHEAAVAERLRAEVFMRAGDIIAARRQIERVLAMLHASGDRRELALCLVERARILALAGEIPAAAKDLLTAEPVLAASANAADRVRLRLARAEALSRSGEVERAASGLRRILAETVELDDVNLAAGAHRLLGEALLDADPTGARHQLMRARHLYDAAGVAFYVADCEISLARAELRLGLNARARLTGVSSSLLAESTLLRAGLSVARAETLADAKPDSARLELFRARAHALDSGNRALAVAIDRALAARQLGLCIAEDELTPVDTRLGGAYVQGGTSTVSISAMTPLTSSNEDGHAMLAGRRAARLIAVEAPNRTLPALALPRPRCGKSASA